MSDTITDGIFKKDTELVYDKNYISNVHKKTERISSACFYIAGKIEDTTRTPLSPLADKIYDAAANVLDTSSETLSLTPTLAKGTLVVLTSELMRLASFVQMAAASERIPSSHAMAIQFEIDALVDVLDEYRSRDVEIRPRSVSRDRRRATVPTFDRIERGQNVQRQSASDEESASRTDIKDRKERIKDILREKGQVGIKDISDIITDVSEKSIQRDLNDMIESGAVVRMGERRWSTYRLS